MPLSSRFNHFLMPKIKAEKKLQKATKICQKAAKTAKNVKFMKKK